MFFYQNRYATMTCKVPFIMEICICMTVENRVIIYTVVRLSHCSIVLGQNLIQKMFKITAN